MPRRMWMCRAAQVVIVPESVEMIAPSLSRSLTCRATTCGLTGVSSRVSRIAHQLPPLLHPLLGLLEERAVLLGLEQRQELLERRPGVADQADAPPDSAGRSGSGRASICTALAWSGLGYHFRYGKVVPTMTSPSHSSIASSEGRVPSRPTPPVVNGESSGTVALPSSGLMIGPATMSASRSSSSPAPRAPMPARITTSCTVDQLGGRLERLGLRDGDGRPPRGGGVARHHLRRRLPRPKASSPGCRPGWSGARRVRPDSAARQAMSTSSRACFGPRIIWL